jgi:sulfate adenylyltransferase subunit 1
LDSVTKASEGRNAGAIDFSLLTDGLRAEREQGITIDVAYRYFTTPKRKFIIADTPGHEQFTRNMVTGASTAELAIILVDARKGLLPQSRRHAFISSLLGIPNLVIAVNKMDLVDFSEAVFRQIQRDFEQFLSQLASVSTYFLPLSALLGDNVVNRSENMPWFENVSLFEHLESVPVGARAINNAFRFPVQRVIRPDLDFRGYAGQIASGIVRPGDHVVVLPSGRKTRVKSIVTFAGPLQQAQAPQSVALTLDDEIDIARGDLIAAVGEEPAQGSMLKSTLVWLSEVPLDLKKRYRFKQTSRLDWAHVDTLEHRININSLDPEPAQSLAMNEIGAAVVSVSRPLFCDPYAANRTTGAFVLIDPFTNSTVAAGMIQSVSAAIPELARHPVTPAERVARHRHRGAIISLGHRDGVGNLLERRLFDQGCAVVRFTEGRVTEMDEWKSTLVEAAWLVIVSARGPATYEGRAASGPEQKARIVSTDGDWTLDLSVPEFADDDEAAANELHTALLRYGVLLVEPEWIDTAGI